jgi:antibiotic biosynthesis monooxygenase (ABM) superfamily enzyme
MLHKRMKIMPENQKIAFDFIESLSDENAYRFYRGYIESNNLDPSAGDTTTTSLIMDF